jgi:hypothetical protein
MSSLICTVRSETVDCAFRDSRRPNLIAVHSGAVTTVEISVSIASQEEGGLTQQFILEVIVLQRSGADRESYNPFAS